jgi:hypothetical protein
MVAELEQHPFTHLIDDVAVRLIIALLLYRLGLLQAMSNVSQELLPFFQVRAIAATACFPRLIGADGRRVTAVDDPEWRVAEGALVGGVEDILHP